MKPHDGEYIHGTEPVEQQRLSLLNELLNEGSLKAMRLAGGETILDVGSGLGQLSRAMARAAGLDGRVIGVERDGDQIAEAERLAREAGEEGLVEFRQGNAVDLPLAEAEWGGFDVVHTRFLLEHVPAPQAIVRAMVRAARPGGRIVLEDDDHHVLRLWPEAPLAERLWRVYYRSYEELGNDPFVGRRLIAMLHQAGAEPTRNDTLFFGSCAGDPNLEAFVENFAGVMASARRQIVASSPLSDDDVSAGLAELRAWGELPDAAMWYHTCWAEGRRPAEGTSRERRRRAATVAAEPAIVPSSQGAVVPLSATRFLADSARDLNSSLDLDELFAKISRRVHLLIDCQLFCVLLWNEDTELLEHSYSLRYGEHVHQEGGFPLGYGLGGSAAALRRPIRVPDVRQDPRYVRFRHAEVTIRSELVVPLIVKDRLIGVLDLESTELDAFSEEHEQMIGALASHVAIALENARLYGKVRANEKRLEEDLATAREIQKGLLPTAAPELPGVEVGAAFVASSELSGDFYDFLPYGDGRLGVAIGDVAGKSTPAALYGALAVGILRGHALHHRSDPAETLRHLNEQLRVSPIPHRFAAMVFAVYDGADRSLTVANSGVPQPLLVRAGEARPIDVRGLPLGSLDDADYRQVRLVLTPGDVVAFTSDGLEECCDAAGERLGTGRLKQVLEDAASRPAQEIAGALIAASDRWTAGAAGDDRTVVVVRFTGGSSNTGAAESLRRSS